VRDDELESRHAKGEPLALMLDPQHRFSMRITIKGASNITSKTHDIEIRDNIASISEVVPNRDLILELGVEKKSHPSLRLTTYRHGDYLYFGVLASPPETAKRVKKISFVEAIDHSGSMKGAKWEVSDFIAKMTYSEIAEMSSEVYIGAFDTNTWWIKVEDRSKLEDFLQREYGGGGTHLGVAIEEGIYKHKKDGVAYNVIITDAQVSDYGRLFRLADKIRELNQRFIIICVDSAPNSFIPIEMARRAGGLSFFLSSTAEGDIVNAVEHISRYWKEPLGSVKINVASEGNLEVEHSQGLHEGNMLELGDLTRNMARWAVGRVKGDLDSELRFELLVDGKKIDEISPGKGEKNKVIKDIFGIHRVNYLECLINARYSPEDLNTLLSSIGYSLELKGGGMIYQENQLKFTREDLDQLLAEIALEFQLASKETSFIAVTKKEGRVEETVVVPNALPEGWKSEPMAAPIAAPSTAPRGAPSMKLMSPASSPSPRAKASLNKSKKMMESAGGMKKSAIPDAPREKPIFEGKTKKGIFFESKSEIRLSSIKVLGSVPKGGKIFIYLKNDSTPVATINLERVKLLGERPLSIFGFVRLESNVDGVEVKLS
jgi:Ca-activated chloride channel family protein